MCCIHRVVCTVPSAVTLYRKLCSVPTKKNIGKSHEILPYLSTANVQLHLNLIYKITCKTYKSLVFSTANCPFFSGVSAVVLILLLGACESKEFPMAEHNNSTKFCLHSQFPTKLLKLKPCNKIQISTPIDNSNLRTIKSAF